MYGAGCAGLAALDELPGADAQTNGEGQALHTVAGLGGPQGAVHPVLLLLLLLTLSGVSRSSSSLSSTTPVPRWKKPSTSLNKSVPSSWSAAIVSPGGQRQPQQPGGGGLPVPRLQLLRGTGLRDQGCGPGAGRQQRFVQAAGRGLGQQLRLGRLGRLGGNSHSILDNTTTVWNVYASRL